MRSTKIVLILYLFICIIAVVGEIKCIVKAVKCNWEPVGKAEVIYTASALTGFGVVVGWIDIEDK